MEDQAQEQTLEAFDGIQEQAPETELPQPKNFDIRVERADVDVNYLGVGAFKVSGPMLIMEYKGNTTIVPINENVLSVEITPVYVEGV